MPETLLSTKAQLGLSFSGTHPPPPGREGLLFPCPYLEVPHLQEVLRNARSTFFAVSCPRRVYVSSSSSSCIHVHQKETRNLKPPAGLSWPPRSPVPDPHSQPLLPSLQTQPWLSSCRPAARGPGHHRPEPHSNARREAQLPHRQERGSAVQWPDHGTTAKNFYDMGSQTWGFCPDAYSPSAPPSTNAELWDTTGFCHLLPRTPQEGIPSLCHKEGKASSVVGPDDRDKTLIPKPISSESHQKRSRTWTGMALKILPRFY